eukprot:TRINITY_DN42166_c0_g1_i1.p1 TRINITY_DN42166_c0_g1~~TRINITY_DN42166_c0_g1_i1.p1  ORF type:complete len:242 (-),score=56.97 TRINITY_DN42166_c0_g1_i1:258-983(-)
MTAAEAKFNLDGYAVRSRAYDQLQSAKAEYGGKLNFAAYRQGRDDQYLGVMGKNYYARPWGNDSSNIQAVLNGPGYWKRVYYRENMGARFAAEDEAAAQRKSLADAAEAAMMSGGNPPNSGGSGGMRRSASDSAVAAKSFTSELSKDTYAPIKESMKPFVEKQGKPKIRAMAPGERFTFFNTLGSKYHMKAGGKNLSWNVSRETHRSTKNELNWMLTNYFRTDSQAILAGDGSDGGVGSDL